MSTPGAPPFEPAGRYEKQALRITKLETFLVKPRWLFLKIHTDAGIVGLSEPPSFTEDQVEIFAAMRQAAGSDVDIAIDFHGAVPPQTAKRLIKRLEPYHPLFVEEPVQAQNVDVLADIAHSTEIPIATGERLFTKWGFREVLEKRAASILQPDLSHAGGIMECRLIAGMAEAYYAGIAPHCPLGPIALASWLQLDAAIPNFLAQEGGRITGEGYLKTPL